MKVETLLDVSIPSVLSEIEAVCLKTQHALEVRGFTDTLFAVELLLREFINNAILHGNQSDPARMVRIILTLEGTRLGIGIEDEGSGFDWKKQHGLIPDNDITSGRGLAIGKFYAEAVSYNPVGNRVELRIQLKQ
jgi:anti-sigma regulatory factor (Ser/Thr protein kinase)